MLTNLALGLLIAGMAVACLSLQERVDSIRNFPARFEVALVVSVMVVAVVFGIANFMFGTAGLNQLGERTDYFRSILAVGLLNRAMCAFSSGWRSILWPARSVATAIRSLTLVDTFTRECLAIEVAAGLRGEDVVRVTDAEAMIRDSPKRVRVDNGPQFVSRVLDQ